MERVHSLDTARAGQQAWGSLQWLVSGALVPDSKLTFGYAEIAPGAKNPLMRHPNCDEVLFVIEGELDHSLEGEVFHLKAGDALHIPRGAKHDASNPGNVAARLVVAYDTPDRQIEILDSGSD